MVNSKTRAFEYFQISKPLNEKSSNEYMAYGEVKIAPHDDLEPAEIEISWFDAFVGNRNFKLDRTKGKNGVISEGGGSVIYISNTITVVEGSYDIGIDSVSVGCLYRSASLNDSQNNEFLKYLSTKISLPEEEDIEKLILMSL